MKLLMISGDKMISAGKKGPFYYMLEEFSKHWERIDIICPQSEKRVNKLFNNVYIHVSDRPDLLQWLFIRKKGREIFQKQKFDVMTVHEYPPFHNGVGASMLKRSIDCPYLLEIHHVVGYPRWANQKEYLSFVLTKYCFRLVAKGADAVRVVNKQVGKFLEENGVAANKIKLIPSFYIDFEIFRPREIKKEYDLVFAARLERNKGILNLINAIEIAKKQKQDISLMIIGSGPLKKELQDYVAVNNLEKNVIFSGWLETVEDVAKNYSKAKIFINPSFNEGGPRVLLEAIACGLPIISTPIGIALDIIEDNKNGIFTDWDPREMADKILLLVKDRDLREKFVSINNELVKKYQKQKEIQNYAEKIKEIVK